MTVRCFTQVQKDTIVDQYQRKIMSQKELALFYNTSERTINRILIEYGVATPVERIKGEAYHTMKLLERYKITLPLLNSILVSLYGVK